MQCVGFCLSEEFLPDIELFLWQGTVLCGIEISLVLQDILFL